MLAIVAFLFLIVSSVNTLESDLKFAHKTDYKKSFNWLGYNIEVTIRKFVRSIVDDESIGLPQIHLYIGEASQQSLLTDVPYSTKNWVKAFMLNNGNLKEIKVNHKGDNPTNWMLYKKSWKIKTKKEEMFGLYRMFNLHSPQYKRFLGEYSSGNIAKRMEVLSPKVQLIELFINDESYGIYIQSEIPNEKYLRRNNIMPVNLYKGEQAYSERTLGLFYDLFNNTSLWSKKAIFNQKHEQDKSDLQNILLLIREAETNALAFERLIEKVDIEIWSKFNAYEILTQSFQSDYMHNQRIIIDPWSGFVHPIVQDPQMQESFFLARHDLSKGLSLESDYTTRTHNLKLLLNRSSKYIDSKYQQLLYYTKEKPVLLEEAKHIKELRELIDVSYSRDIHHLTFHPPVDISNFVESLKFFNDYITKRLHATPNSLWTAQEKSFIITINGEIPISDIVVTFEGAPPEWIALDLNGNDFIDAEDIKVSSDKASNSITIPVRLYANRIMISGESHLRDRNMVQKDLQLANTGFKFISSNNIQIQSVSAGNPFSGNRLTLRKRKSDYVLPSMLNVPLINNKIESTVNNEIRFSGIVNILKDEHIRSPVSILPGTVINLDAGTSLIFHNKVTAEGTPQSPIRIRRKDSGRAWGTFALQGMKTNGSVFSHINMSGGSGSEVNGIFYTSMFSLHNTRDITISESRFNNNETYDDMLHIVYGDDITLSNVFFRNSAFDAIDIDMSKNIFLKNLNIVNSLNDAIDLMESEVLIDQVFLYKSGDKGISAGENSNVLVHNSLLHSNNIGLASKDGSNVQMLYSNLDSNGVQISAYKKNWQYGDGGHIRLYNSIILHGEQNFNVDTDSNIVVMDTTMLDKPNQENKNITIFSSQGGELLNKNIVHPLYDRISTGGNLNSSNNIRGFQGFEKSFINSDNNLDIPLSYKR